MVRETPVPMRHENENRSQEFMAHHDTLRDALLKIIDKFETRDESTEAEVYKLKLKDLQLIWELIKTPGDPSDQEKETMRGMLDSMHVDLGGDIMQMESELSGIEDVGMANTHREAIDLAKQASEAITKFLHAIKS